MELALPGESRIAVSDSDVREALACMRDPCSEYDDIQPVVGYDIETGGLRPMYDPLCLAQLSNAKLAVAIPYKDISPAAQGMFLDFLRDDSSRPPLVAHNSNFEWRFSAAAGAEITGGLLDTMVLEQVLTAGLKAEVGLEDTVARRLHLEMPKAQQTAYWMAHHSKYTKQMWQYAWVDAVAPRRLYATQIRLLRRDNLMAIADLEMACIIPYARMGWNGMAVDGEGLQQLAKQKQAEAEGLVPQVVAALTQRRAELGLQPYNSLLPLGDEYASTDIGFSLSSPTELGRELIALGVPLEQTEKSKEQPGKPPVYKTDKQALKEQALDLPFLTVIADYSALASEAQAARTILDVLDPNTGRCHAEFKQNFTDTGRSSTTRPNSQNVPRSKAFRGLIVPKQNGRLKRCGPPKDRRFILCDYGQIELRVVAQITKDPVMLATYNDPDGDLHRRTAAICNNIAESAVDAEARRGAKGVNFGLCFAMKPKKLRQTCFEQYSFKMSEEEAYTFHQRYFEEYQGVAEWHSRLEHMLRRGEITSVVSLGGRRRLLPEEDRRLQLVSNTFVQSVAANIMKLAVSRMERSFAEVGIESALLINVVHDELLVEVDEDEAELCKEVVSAVMCDAEAEVLTNVPPEAEAAVANSWADK